MVKLFAMKYRQIKRMSAKMTIRAIVPAGDIDILMRDLGGMEMRKSNVMVW